MSTQTDFLDLILPANGEFVDTWQDPVNENFTAVNAWAKGINTEVVAARFSADSVADFLAVAHNSDGTLKPTTEMTNAHNSFLYGDENGSAVTFDLPTRLNQIDRDIFNARGGAGGLRDQLGVLFGLPGKLLQGSVDGNGYSTWLGHTGANTQFDGSSTSIYLLIGGLFARIRKLQTLTITGGSGTKYLYAAYNANGVVTVDGSGGTNGTIASDGTKVRTFQDLTTNFSTSDVKPGDIITILGTSPNAGQYQVKTVAPSGNNNQLKIYGVFPGGALTGLSYTITDPFAVTLGFDTVKTPSSTKFYLGEADFDGASVTATRAIHTKDYFVGEWRAIDVSSVGTFEQIWNHYLFDDALEVILQVSQANDGSAPVEALSMAQLNNTLVFSPASSGATLTGSVSLTRTLLTKWTTTTINVKNPTSGTFYTDYSGTVRQTGYLRVVVTKKRV